MFSSRTATICSLRSITLVEIEVAGVELDLPLVDGPPPAPVGQLSGVVDLAHGKPQPERLTLHVRQLQRDLLVLAHIVSDG
jgi:hypothetical protein